MNQWHCRRGAEVLHRGGVVAYPTESCFGLGCDPRNDVALSYLLWLKQRPTHKGLILIAAHFDQLEPYVLPTSVGTRQKLERSWPGPFTWLLPANSNVSGLLTGEHNTLAVRVTAHPVAAALCEQFGGAIVSTSANLAGRPAAKTQLDLCRQFSRNLDYVVPGDLGTQSQPSEIRDALSDELIRPGVNHAHP